MDLQNPEQEALKQPTTSKPEIPPFRFPLLYAGMGVLSIIVTNLCLVFPSHEFASNGQARLIYYVFLNAGALATLAFITVLLIPLINGHRPSFVIAALSLFASPVYLNMGKELSTVPAVIFFAVAGVNLGLAVEALRARPPKPTDDE
jgi:hypothetical protein